MPLVWCLTVGLERGVARLPHTLLNAPIRCAMLEDTTEYLFNNANSSFLSCNAILMHERK